MVLPLLREAATGLRVSHVKSGEMLIVFTIIGTLIYIQLNNTLVSFLCAGVKRRKSSEKLVSLLSTYCS